MLFLFKIVKSNDKKIQQEKSKLQEKLFENDEKMNQLKRRMRENDEKFLETL